MKFAKKIFVGIIAVALLVSCLALSTSAEAPTRPIKDITSVLEYNELETYLIENYEGYAEGEFVFNPKSSDYVDAPVFKFLSADGVSESVIAEGENKLLAIKNASSAPEGYKFLAEDPDDMLPRIVMSFDFKSGDGTLGGSDVVLLATLCDYFEDVPLFSANLSGEELRAAIEEKIAHKDEKQEGQMGTTPRRLTDLIGSLCDLTSGSGDKGTPIVYIHGYFDNYVTE